MLNWITSKAWEETMQWLYESIVKFMNDFFLLMNNMGAELFDLPWIQAIVLFFSYFGWALYIIGLVVAVFDTALEAQSGKADFKTTAINALKGFFAVSLFTVAPIRLYIFSISLQSTFSNGLTSLIGGSSIKETSLDALSSISAGETKVAIFTIFLLLALGYCVIKIFMQNIKRGGILLIQIAVGSLYMFSVPRGYTDGFIHWCKKVIGLCLTAFLQASLLIAGLITFKNSYLLGLGVMLAASEVERIAETFGLDTSVKGNMSSAVHTANTSVSLIKMFKK